MLRHQCSILLQFLSVVFIIRNITTFFHGMLYNWGEYHHGFVQYNTNNFHLFPQCHNFEVQYSTFFRVLCLIFVVSHPYLHKCSLTCCSMNHIVRSIGPSYVSFCTFHVWYYDEVVPYSQECSKTNGQKDPMLQVL